MFYVGADGKARFANRVFRKPGAPVMTIDGETVPTDRFEDMNEPAV